MKQIEEFKIRCSAIGQIMTEPQGKTPYQKWEEARNKFTESRDKYDLIEAEKRGSKSANNLYDKVCKLDSEALQLFQTKDEILLSGTCQTFLEGWLKTKLYNRRKEFHSKYTDKGNEVEDDSLDFVAAKLGYGMLLKNEEHFGNDYMNGTPDAIPAEVVIDVKNSWDPFTFPLFDTEIPTEGYWWQLQGYMELTGRDKAELIYTLMDTPAHLIEREARYYSLRMGFGELEQELYEEFVAKMTYPDIPDNLKIKRFTIEKDSEAIERIESRVKDCRVYIEGLLKGVNNK